MRTDTDADTSFGYIRRRRQARLAWRSYGQFANFMTRDPLPYLQRACTTNETSSTPSFRLDPPFRNDPDRILEAGPYHNENDDLLLACSERTPDSACNVLRLPLVYTVFDCLNI